MSKQKRALILVFIATALWLFGLRFILSDLDAVHHHANFAIYVDGERDPLESFTFYEEVSACSAEHAADPKSRVHLHDQNPYTIHVHDAASTWSHLLANLNYGLTDSVLQTDKGIYIHDESDNPKQLRFILNGKATNYIANEAIQSEDSLLIDYSDSSENTVLMRYESIPRNAAEYNSKPDPASCAGGSDEAFWARVKRTAGF